MDGQPNAELQVYLLGRFRVVRHGRVLPDATWRRRKARQLFKCLISRPSRRLTKDEAFELLWPDSDPEAAAGNLRSTVHAIRHALDEPSVAGRDSIVLVDRETVYLNPRVGLWIDTEAFERAFAQAQQAADPWPLLQRANALYGGDYLPDDLYEDWAVERRAALKRLWSALQLALAQRAERRGDPDEAAGALLRLLSADPCDERAAQELMRLYARLGRRADALRVYRRLEQALCDELGVDPSDETVEVQRELVAAGARRTADEAAAPLAAPAAIISGRRGDGSLGAASAQAAVQSRPAFSPSYPFPAPSRLVDRQAELARLNGVLQRGRTGGQAVLVGAPAGTGKSTLVGAIVQRAEQVGVLCLAGGCYEQAGVVPLGPFQEALADYLLAQPPDHVRTELGSAAADLARLAPELSYHLDLPAPPSTDPRVDRSRLFGAVHACLRSLTERGPVLLCLEDLHATDAATLRLVHYLARQTRRLPLTIIGTYRTEDAPPGRPLAQLIGALLRERLAEQITLGALDRDDTAQLVAALLEGPTSEALNDSLYAATEGNPLFLEQLILALREEGRVDRSAGLWQEVADRGRAIPELVREVIERRFERLRPSCRDALAMAAAVGQSVPYAVLLAALEPREEAALLADLDEALAAQLLNETPSGYAFGHELVREAIYWSLSAPRRMLLHARVGEAIERLAGSRAVDQAAELAHHFALAGESAAVRAKALRYSLEAGHRAAALASHHEALAHFSRACELLERDRDADPRARLDALEGRGNAQRMLGVWLAAIADFERVLELTEEPVRRAWARNMIGFCRERTGDTASALAEYDAALAELRAGHDSPQAAIVRLRLQVDRAYVWFLQGRYREMLGQREAMLRTAEELRQPRCLFWARNAIGLAYMGQGQVELALQEFELARAAAGQSDDKVDLAIAQQNLGIEYYFAGQFATAGAELERAAALYRDAAADWRPGNALQFLGRVALAEGDLKRAHQQGQRACALATEAHDRWAAACHDLLGMVATLRAEWETAEASFTRALQIRQGSQPASGRVESLVGLGLVRQRRGDWPRARALHREAVEVAGAMDPSPWAVLAHRHLGSLLSLMGDQSAADQLERALQLAETMPRSAEYAPTLLALAEIRWRGDDLAAGIEYAEQALAAGMAAEQAVEARSCLADLYQQSGSLEPAHSHAAEAVRLAERVGAPRLLGLAHRAAGRLGEASGTAAAAAASFRTALRAIEVVELPYERALILRDHGRALARFPGQAEPARARLEEALAVFRRLGARPAATDCEAWLRELSE